MAKCPKCGKFTIPESVVGDTLAVIADVSISLGIDFVKSIITKKNMQPSRPTGQLFTTDKYKKYCCSQCGYKWSEKIKF